MGNTDPAPKAINSRRAVIDLGSNTFHLLIADLDGEGGLRDVYRERIYVKLASEGIATIGDTPFSRGIAALQHFRRVLDKYAVTQLKAIGTAALRTASNGPDFVLLAKREANISIELISGDEEARLITQGVLAAIPPIRERVLIMDIGGGSTEFIIAGPAGVHWRQSFPIGVSVLHNGFHHSDPITAGEIYHLEDFLLKQTAPLAAALREFPTHHLVGAAGTFDVLAVALKDPTAPLHPSSHQLNLSGLDELSDRIIAASMAERLAMDGIPDQRADLVVVAMILLRFTFKLAGIDQVTVSDWAMKEGVLLEG